MTICLRLSFACPSPEVTLTFFQHRGCIKLFTAILIDPFLYSSLFEACGLHDLVGVVRDAWGIVAVSGRSRAVLLFHLLYLVNEILSVFNELFHNILSLEQSHSVTTILLGSVEVRILKDIYNPDPALGAFGSAGPLSPPC